MSDNPGMAESVKKQKILIIDDVPDNITQLQIFLQKLARRNGVEVEVFSAVDLATSSDSIERAAAKNSPFDIIFADVSVPDCGIVPIKLGEQLKRLSNNTTLLLTYGGFSSPPKSGTERIDGRVAKPIQDFEVLEKIFVDRESFKEDVRKNFAEHIEEKKMLFDKFKIPDHTEGRGGRGNGYY